jgi:hypothetical protein
LNLVGQGFEGAGKGDGPGLQGGSHGSPGLANGELTGGDFTAGLIKFGSHFVGQFEVVFHIVIEPTVKLRQFSGRESRISWAWTHTASCQNALGKPKSGHADYAG